MGGSKMNELEEGIFEQVKSIHPFLMAVPWYNGEDHPECLEVGYETITGTVEYTEDGLKGFLIGTKAKSLGRFIMASVSTMSKNKLSLGGYTKYGVNTSDELLEVITREKPDFLMADAKIVKKLYDIARTGDKCFKFSNNTLTYSGTLIIRNDYLCNTNEEYDTIICGDFKFGDIREGVFASMKNIQVVNEGNIITLSCDCGITDIDSTVYSIALGRKDES
jgi:hypothetical protein